MAPRVRTRNPYALATSVYQGKLYVLSGQRNEVERYDPSLNSWASVKSLKEVTNFAAAVTFQGYLYVIGGIDDDGNSLDTVQQYNPDTNLWQKVSSLKCPRSSVCAVSDGNNIYAIGGVKPSGYVCNTVEKFDAEIKSWNIIAPTRAERRNAGGVSLRSKIFVFGGVDVDGGISCEMYDKVAEFWTQIESVVAPRCCSSAVGFKGQIFVLGGFGSNQSEGQELTLQVYDVDNNEWKPCCNVLLGSKLYKLSAGRILKEALDFIEEIPEP